MRNRVALGVDGHPRDRVANLPFGMLADRYPLKPVILAGGTVVGRWKQCFGVLLLMSEARLRGTMTR